MQITNTSRGTQTFRTKAGKAVSLAPGETASHEVDRKHPKIEALEGSGILVFGDPKTARAATGPKTKATRAAAETKPAEAPVSAGQQSA